ncbi:MAG: GAF domain-containing protein [Chloroflexota bacterium]|nr:GAF domain-containing protein [Chloroflexota bacterium]
MSALGCLAGVEKAGPPFGSGQVVAELVGLDKRGKTGLSDSAEPGVPRRLRLFTDPALAGLPVDGLLHQLLSRLMEATKADCAGVLLLSPEGESFSPLTGVGTHARLPRELSIPASEGIAGRIASSVHPTATSHGRVLDPGSSLFGKLRHVAGVPLTVEGELLGILYAGKLDRSLHARFSHGDGQLLQLAGDRIGLALRSARLAAAAAAQDRQLRSAMDKIARIREVQRQKDESVAGISHDLRAPLAALKLRAQLAQRRLASPADWPDIRGRLAHELAEIQTIASRLTVGMENLMDLSRRQGGHALAHHPEAVDLDELVHHVVAEEELVNEADISFGSRVGRLEGCWDPDQLHRAFSNLIDNAIKFSPGRRRVEVSLDRELAVDRQWAVVSVTDSGLGIPEADLPHIFNRFYRGRNAHAARGSGLGLTSVQQIVHAHGGTVSVVSREGRGTTVTVRLPAGPPVAGGR